MHRQGTLRHALPQPKTKQGISSMLPNIEELRAILAQTANTELLPRFARVERGRKGDGSIVTAADLAVQERIRKELTQRWPEYHLLGEEMDEQEQRRLLAEAGPGLWCLDPLDGTSNFAAGIPYFSISLALLVGGAPVIGLVYDPARDECFTAHKGQGAQLNGTPLATPGAPPALQHCIAAIDFKRLDAPLAVRLAQHPPYSSQRSFGSVALDWCWVAAGRFHVYLHGKQRLWDYAAGALILAEAGGHAATLEGMPVSCTDIRPSSVLASLDEQLFHDWQTWIGGT